MLLAVVVISSSAARRFIIQSQSFCIIASFSSLWYLTGCKLFVRCLVRVFYKFPFVHKSCEIPVEMSLARIYWSFSSEYPNQWTWYCDTRLRGALYSSNAFSTSYLSYKTGPGFSNWPRGNRVELLFTQGLTLLSWTLLYIRFRLGSEKRSKLPLLPL